MLLTRAEFEGLFLPHDNPIFLAGLLLRYCVEMIETLRNAFVGTDRKGEFTQQQIAAIAIDFIETPAEFKAVQHVGTNTRTKEQIEGLVSKKLWGQ